MSKLFASKGSADEKVSRMRKGGKEHRRQEENTGSEVKSCGIQAGGGNNSSNVDIGTNLRHIHACCKTFADAADRQKPIGQ